MLPVFEPALYDAEMLLLALVLVLGLQSRELKVKLHTVLHILKQQRSTLVSNFIIAGIDANVPLGVFHLFLY